MLLLMILMFSPLSFNYFYVWLIYPLALALHLMQSSPVGSGRRRIFAFVFATPLLLLALAIPFLRAAQAYGNLFFCCVVLFFGLAWELRWGSRAAVEATPPFGGPGPILRRTQPTGQGSAVEIASTGESSERSRAVRLLARDQRRERRRNRGSGLRFSGVHHDLQG